ncbi:hypothetical protein [Bounagaea algeriensis]
MTYQPPPPGYAAPSQLPREKFKGLAWSGLILGIVGVVGSIIPILNNLTAVAAFVGLILAIIGLFGTKKVVAGIGAGLSVLAVVFTVLVQQAFMNQLDESFNNIEGTPQGATNGTEGASPSAENADGGGTVVYTVEGSGSGMSVTYGANGSTSQDTDPTFPWSAEEPAGEGFDFYTLTAQNGDNGGEVTCRISIDGQVVDEATSTGAYSMVNCSGNTGF